MSKKVFSNKFVFLVALPIVLIGCGLIYRYYLSAIDPYPDFPGTLIGFTKIGNSKINPQTILEAVKRGDTDYLFQMESDFPEDPQFVMPIEWTQNEYQNIVVSVHQIVWGETLDGWNLYRMDFDANCKDDPKGLSSAGFYYYKETVVKGREMYLLRGVELDPEYGHITWGSASWHPPTFWGKWKTIKLDKVTVPAEEALKIADKKDGLDYRAFVGNQCEIWISMSPERYDRSDWQVWYGNNKTFWIPSK